MKTSTKQRLRDKLLINKLNQNIDHLSSQNFQQVSKIIAEEVVNRALDRDHDNDWDYYHEGEYYDLSGCIRRGELMLLQQLLQRLDTRLSEMRLTFSDGSVMCMSLEQDS